MARKRGRRKKSAGRGSTPRRSHGVLQGMRSAFRRAAGAESRPAKPSKLGSAITWLLFAAAIALLVYRLAS